MFAVSAAMNKHTAGLTVRRGATGLLSGQRREDSLITERALSAIR
jgi:hypothetical protein